MDWIASGAARGARVLDVAAGRGRHALPLARAGARVFGVDIRHDSLLDAAAAAAEEHLRLNLWCADLTTCALPRDAFDAIVVARYLQRDLFPAIAQAVVPGGVVVYETFTVDQLAHGVGPRSPDHLLQRSELRGAFDRFDVMFYEEISSPEAVARLIARRRV